MTGGAAAAAGAVIWADALAARLLLRADDSYVYFLGRPVAVTCWLRNHLGIPCPTCGLSRGLVLSLHARWSEAWRIFPVAPVALAGALLLASALLAVACLQAWGSPAASLVARQARKWGLVWIAGATLLWIGAWLMQVL
jgi:hypothetical protein